MVAAFLHSCKENYIKKVVRPSFHFGGALHYNNATTATGILGVLLWTPNILLYRCPKNYYDLSTRVA